MEQPSISMYFSARAATSIKSFIKNKFINSDTAK
jgi:hypothetical protein